MLGRLLCWLLGHDREVGVELEWVSSIRTHHLISRTVCKRCGATLETRTLIPPHA